MILMIDNYDSFTYNLVQYLSGFDEEVMVKRNDEITINEIKDLDIEAIIVSPGPGRPENAGISVDLINEFKGQIPILGVCLGHQAIAFAFGAQIVHAKKIMHGKSSIITGDEKGVFSGIKKPVQVMRYHSLAVNKETLPNCLEISAFTEDGEIMGLRHKKYIVEGIQFHPESIMTPQGKRMLRNFIKISKEFKENQCL
ncbi:MAG: aminodeoxychorismate/anthranilate synthase component II [Desulforegulaceae bacterium]|nr:aminodeoxychorismate/anthranilate synthase component II [Desulforegulaceae bacterium]